MWPSKHHLGVQLTYGIQGNGIVVPEEVRESQDESQALHPKVRFPRLRDQGPLLREIENSEWKLPSSGHDDSHESTTSMAWFRRKTHSTIFAPDLITESLAVESAPLNESFAYNPTEGTRIASLELGVGAFSDPIILEGKRVYPKSKSGVLHLQGVAYVSGENYTDLFVAPLLPKSRNATNGENSETRAIVVSDSIQDKANYACCSFPSAILQIQPSSLLPIIGVRCRESVHFVEYSWSNDPRNKGPILKELPCTIELHDLTKNDFAHIEFSPSTHDIAVIDIGGNISTWSLNYDKSWTVSLRFSSNPFADDKSDGGISIADPEDLSNWKRVCWHPTSYAMLAVSRQSATFFQFENMHTPTKQKLVTAKTWTRIWDLKSCAGFVFLLTSNEIILLEFDDETPLQRLISWKHFLDNENTTYKLHVCESSGGQSFICSIFSKQTPVAMIYTFGFQDSKPVLLRDPYFIRTKEGCRDFFFESLNYTETDSLVFYQVQAAADGFSVSALHGSQKLTFNPSREQSASCEPIPAPRTNPVFNWISLAEASNAYYSYSIPTTTDIEEELLQEDEDGPLTQVELVQKYAFTLGAEIKKQFGIDTENGQESISENNSEKEIPSFVSLSSAADSVPIFIDDVDEFDSMVEQLSEFYATNGIEVEGDFKPLFERYGYSKSSSEHFLKSTLNALFPEHPNVNQAAVILASSLCKISHEDIDKRLLNLYKEEVKSCDNELTAMFDEWDHTLPRERAKSAPPTVDTKKRGLLHRALTQNSQIVSSQMSQPVFSQDSSQESITSSQPPIESSQDLFVPSQSQPTQSQARPKSRPSQLKRPGSQSASQRKKKKKGGFA